MTYIPDWDKISPEAIIFIFKRTYKLINKLRGKNEAKKVLSCLFGELLSKSPDLDWAKAYITQIESSRLREVVDRKFLQRAKSMLEKVESHQGKTARRVGKFMGTRLIGIGKKIRMPIAPKIISKTRQPKKHRKVTKIGLRRRNVKFGIVSKPHSRSIKPSAGRKMQKK